MGATIKRKRFGASYRALAEEFSRRQWQSAGDLSAYRDERLRELVLHAYTHVPHYRRVMDERGIAPSDIQGVSDLPRLPILQKAEVKAAPHSFVARNAAKQDRVLGETSGTSGAPIAIYWDRRVVLVNAVVEWRQKGWGGIRPGDAMATMFYSRAAIPAAQTRPPFWRHNRPLNQLILSALHLSPENIPHYLGELRRFKPLALESYPSAATLLARALLDRGETLPLRCVFTTSETCHPVQRKLISEAFGCGVFDAYGMAERAVYATECERHSGLHFNEDYGITEILDLHDQPVGPGTSGRIVATGLHNPTMPFIRYDTGDTGSILPEACPCGRAFPLCPAVEGRYGDSVITHDGRVISPTALTGATDPLTRVEECQLIQTTRSRILVRVVRGEDYGENDTVTLKQNLARLLGEGMIVDVEYVDRIERTRAGKFRWVISEIAADS